MKYNERRKKPPKKKAEIIVNLDKKENSSKDVKYKFRSGIEASVHIPNRIWKYPQKKPLRPVYYPKVSAISSRSRDLQ